MQYKYWLEPVKTVARSLRSSTDPRSHIASTQSGCLAVIGAGIHYAYVLALTLQVCYVGLVTIGVPENLAMAWVPNVLTKSHGTFSPMSVMPFRFQACGSGQANVSQGNPDHHIKAGCDQGHRPNACFIWPLLRAWCCLGQLLRPLAATA